MTTACAVVILSMKQYESQTLLLQNKSVMLKIIRGIAGLKEILLRR